MLRANDSYCLKVNTSRIQDKMFEEHNSIYACKEFFNYKVKCRFARVDSLAIRNIQIAIYCRIMRCILQYIASVDLSIYADLNHDTLFKLHLVKTQLSFQNFILLHHSIPCLSPLLYLL